ncbi:MAG: peptidase U35 [Myxococcales bacterium]|nr:peptidase U35 [Myxococcales bacterium]
MSDFAELLTGTGDRILRRAYDSYQGGIRRACREVQARDFRPIQKLQLSEAGQLEQVNEGGEFSRSTMSEAKETYSLATFGRIFGLSRQALINDDLGAFGEMNQKLGRAAAEFVASQLVTLLTSNPTMADSVAVFHADHANLDGSGAVISVASLGAALQAMRRQKGLDGVTSIDVTPRYLMVPAALETVGRQVLTSIAATTVADVNPYHDQMELIVDPRLDDDSEVSWYVAADPSAIDTIEYAFLEGTSGPQLSMREGFEVDGAEFKVRVDYGAGVIDHRGLYKNVGA